MRHLPHSQYIHRSVYPKTVPQVRRHLIEHRKYQHFSSGPIARHNNTIIAAVPIPFRITAAEPKKIFPTACAVFPSPGIMLMVCVTDIFFRLSTDGAIIGQSHSCRSLPPATDASPKSIPRFNNAVIREISFPAVIQFNICNTTYT